MYQSCIVVWYCYVTIFVSIVSVVDVNYDGTFVVVMLTVGMYTNVVHFIRMYACFVVDSG